MNDDGSIADKPKSHNVRLGTRILIIYWGVKFLGETLMGVAVMNKGVYLLI
jgi:hypothetical protein